MQACLSVGSGQRLSQREGAQRFLLIVGRSRKWCRILRLWLLPSLRARTPKLDRHVDFIDQILANNLNCPKKQRHPTQLIYDVQLIRVNADAAGVEPTLISLETFS